MRFVTFVWKNIGRRRVRSADAIHLRKGPSAICGVIKADAAGANPQVAFHLRREHLTLDGCKLKRLAFRIQRLDGHRRLLALHVGGDFAIRGLRGLARPADHLLPETGEIGPLQPFSRPPAVGRAGERDAASQARLARRQQRIRLMRRQDELAQAPFRTGQDVPVQRRQRRRHPSQNLAERIDHLRRERLFDNQRAADDLRFLDEYLRQRLGVLHLVVPAVRR